MSSAGGRFFMKEKDKGENGHYSDKGGHMVRSAYWKIMARIAFLNGGSVQPIRALPVETAQVIRRSMRRITDSGRR